MNPMLSIIIPFYGNADKQLLNRCIKSIEEQGLSADSYEVIVADDEGLGLGGARNIGIGKAQGDYLLFVDADDYLLSGGLLSLIDLIQSQNPDMLSFGYQMVSDDAILTPKSIDDSFAVYSSGADYMLQHNFLGTAWRHLFRREWILQHQLLFSESSYHEDEAFVAKAYCLAATTVISNKVIYAYSQYPHSILHRIEKEQRSKRLDDFAKLLLDLKQFDGLDLNEIQHHALQRRLHFLTIDFLFQMWRNRCSLSDVRIRIKSLHETGFLPLPSKGYSSKYKVARCFINTICRK